MSDRIKSPGKCLACYISALLLLTMHGWNVASAAEYAPAATVEGYVGEADKEEVTSLYAAFTTLVNEQVGIHLEAVSDDIDEDRLKGYPAQERCRWGGTRPRKPG